MFFKNCLLGLTSLLLTYSVPLLAADKLLEKAKTQHISLLDKTPNNQKLYDLYPYSIMYYYGETVSDALGRIVLNGEIHRWPEHIQTIELAQTLSEQNILRRFFSPVVGVVQMAGNFGIRQGSNDSHHIYEVDPYLIFRWANLPWNNYLTTSFAVGEGVSYVTAVPSLEKKTNKSTKRFLNYLMLEATFAHPQYPRLQFVARIHHRSGAYGLYRAGNTGSNDLGLGIRYLFD